MKISSLSLILTASFIGILNAQESIELTAKNLVVKDGEIVDIIMPSGMNKALNSAKKKKHHRKKHHKKHQMKEKVDKNDELEKLADKLIQDFNISFNEPETNTNDNNNNNNNNNGTPETGSTSNKSENVDDQINQWTKQVFSRPHERHLDSNGRPMKYYKDNSIPIMFRKVIPPSGQKLPLLQFKYHEDGKLCKCMCKV